MTNFNQTIFKGFIALFFISFSSLSFSADTIPATLESTGYCKISSTTHYDVDTLDKCVSYVSDYFGEPFDSNPNSDYYEIRRVSNNTLKATFVPTSESYVCLDPDYPTLTSDGLNCSSSFLIDQAVIDAYLATEAEFSDTATIMSADLETKGEAIAEMGAFFSDLLQDTALASSQTNEIANMLDTVGDAVSQYPDSQTIQDSYDEISSLSFDSSSSFATAQSNLNTVSELTTELTNNYNSQVQSLESLFGNASTLNTTATNMAQCDGSYCWDSYVNIGNNATNDGYGDIANYNTIQNIDNSMTESNIDNAVSNVTTNVSNITNNYNNSTTVINNISNYTSYGETCSGSTCVANPAPDPGSGSGSGSGSGDGDGEGEGEGEEEEGESNVPQSTIKDTPVGESFYETLYPDGFQGLYDQKISAIKSTELFQGVSNFEFSGSGTPPTWTINLGTMGSFDASVPAYVWSFVKLCLLVTCGFLCRALIFGG